MNEIEAIAVRLVGADSPIPTTVQPVAKPGIRTVPRTINVDNTGPVMLLPNAPKRRRAVLTIVGQSTDVVYLCDSRSAAQGNAGAIAMGLQVITLQGTSELWVASATSVAIGVLAEYED